MHSVAQLPSSGAVVGIDVGYSRKKNTTGLCILEWTLESVVWACRNAGSAEASRCARLQEIAPSSRKVLAAAVDGPLVPGLLHHTGYRACEALLSRGVLQRRGKPGPTNGGSGPALHREATRLAFWGLAELEIAPATHGVPIHERAVVEAFPNLFLGALCDEEVYPERAARKRRWTDTLFPLVSLRLQALLQTLLPGRTIKGPWGLTHHEEIAGLTCALTALCVAASRFTAVGAKEDGFIFLPPRDAMGRGWEDTLRTNLRVCLPDFPTAQLIW